MSNAFRDPGLFPCFGLLLILAGKGLCTPYAGALASLTHFSASFSINNRLPFEEVGNVSLKLN